MERETLTHFSLCTGIGGLDLAAEWAGFQTIGQCEIDEYASKVLAKNFKGVKNYGDIRAINAELLRADGIEPGAITVLSAGFPCQPYSLAGKGLGSSDERDLWDEVIRVIKILKPKYVVLENTPGLFARENQRYFDRVVQDLSALGYSVGWGMWGACDVGAPHERQRVFFVANKISNTYSKRQPETKILDRESAKGLSEASLKRIQTSRYQFDRIYSRALWDKANPSDHRDFNGFPIELHRLRCLGNAVVPQQAYPIFKAIADVKNKRSKTCLK